VKAVDVDALAKVVVAGATTTLGVGVLMGMMLLWQRRCCEVKKGWGLFSVVSREGHNK